METRHFDVYLFGFKAFRAELAKQALFFHLWRENVVAQAISLYRAHETNFYHSTSVGKKLEPPYNAEGVLRWLHHLVDTENGNVRLIQRLGVPARNLRYEEIVKSREKTVELFARALSVPFDPGAFGGPVEGELQKLADGWNEAAERRLRLENAVEVAALEAKRLVKSASCPIPIEHRPRNRLTVRPGRRAWMPGRLAAARSTIRSITPTPVARYGTEVGDRAGMINCTCRRFR